MKTLYPAIFLIVAVSSCSKRTIFESAKAPDNDDNLKKIILKEGQSVMIMMEGYENLKIGVSHSDGKLNLAEIDQKGRAFSVSWKDTDTWSTLTSVSDGQNSICTGDSDGDGYADIKAEITSSGSRRYKLQGDKWVEIKSNIKESEQAAPSNR